MTHSGPLSRRLGITKLCFGRARRATERSITIEDPEVLVIEGCETLHLSLIGHLDLRIWLDTDPEVSMKRGIRRDLEEHKLDSDRVVAAWKEWSAWEAHSLAHDDRRERAEIMRRKKAAST